MFYICQQLFCHVGTFPYAEPVQNSEDIKCLAQGNKVPPRKLEPGTSLYQIEHSAIEPLCSSTINMYPCKFGSDLNWMMK